MPAQRSVIAIALAVTITGCASGLLSQPAPLLSADEIAQYSGTTPSQLVAAAEDLLKKAHDAEFSFYAPNTLERMQQQVKEMQSYGTKPDADKTKLVLMRKGIEQLFQSGTSNKNLVQAQLANVLEQKKILDQLNAARALPSEYKDIMDDVIDLVEYLEAGKPDKARSGTPSVMQDMQKLEIRIVKDNVLGRAKTLLAEAKDKNAGDKARKSYDEATLAYDRAIKLIDTNPRDRDQIAKVGAEATFLAQRSVRLTEEVTKLQQIKPKEMEQVALEAEQRMQRIAEAMQHPDVRNLSLHEQSVALARAAEKHSDQSDKMASDGAESEKLKAELTQTQEKIKRLESVLVQYEAEKKALQAKLDTAPAAPTPASIISDAPTAAPAVSASTTTDEVVPTALEKPTELVPPVNTTP